MGGSWGIPFIGAPRGIRLGGVGGRELGYTFYRSNTWYKDAWKGREGIRLIGAPSGKRLEGVEGGGG